jgi:hypothetical protein
MTNSAKRKKTLPDRYPRERAILIFEEMFELDHVIELLDQMGQNLASLDAPDREWDDKADKLWVFFAADPLTFLITRLQKAFLEYERFWQPEDWTAENDVVLQQALVDSEEMWWRLNELREGCWRGPSDNNGYTRGEPFRAYDPALLACGEALYLALILQQSHGDKKWVLGCVSDLKLQLTRYYAASLEILRARKSVFTSGRTAGAYSPIHQHLRKLYQKLYFQHGTSLDFDSFWKAIERECSEATVKTPSLVLQETDGDELHYRISGKEKLINRLTVRNKFPYYKTGDLDKYFRVLWSSLALPVQFKLVWDQIKAECDKPTLAIAWLKLEKVDDEALYYQASTKCFSVPKSEVRNKFRVFMKEKPIKAKFI